VPLSCSPDTLTSRSGRSCKGIRRGRVPSVHPSKET
jgi:hypothetical protein